MKKIVVYFSLLIGLISCKSEINNDFNNNLDSNKDTINYVIFKFDTTKTWIFPSNYKPTNLTVDEIQEIQNLMKQYIDIYNENQKKELEVTMKRFNEDTSELEKYLINLKNYKQQFIPVINPSGEKEVWVNCVCNNAIVDWRKDIINIQGGGICFFNLKVNLTQKKCYYLVVTGV